MMITTLADCYDTTRPTLAYPDACSGVPQTHRVEVIRCKRIHSYKSGNDGVSYSLADWLASGAHWSIVFWLTPRAIFRLASFAKACGIPRDEACWFHLSDSRCHERLVGCSVMVSVGRKDGKPEVVNWWPA